LLNGAQGRTPESRVKKRAYFSAILEKDRFLAAYDDMPPAPIFGFSAFFMCLLHGR
jgi:hypothetical protein